MEWYQLSVLSVGNECDELRQWHALDVKHMRILAGLGIFN